MFWKTAPSLFSRIGKISHRKSFRPRRRFVEPSLEGWISQHQMIKNSEKIRLGSRVELAIAGQLHNYVIAEEEDHGDIPTLLVASALGRRLLGRSWPDQFRHRLNDGRVVPVEIRRVTNEI